MKIDSSIVAVTGAGGGLGQAMATTLAGAGAKIALLDARPEPMEALAGTLGDAALALTCDVTDEDAVAEAFAKIRAHFGGLDALVNNAGITRDALLLKFRDGERVGRMSLADWQAVLDVNLTGVFLCGREAAELMAAGDGGVIVNISSISRAGNMGQGNYSAAKAGVAALTVTWARELARYRIRVNAISPGFIDTEMVQAIKPEALEKLKAMIPARRVGRPEEIAAAVQFILENDFMNGRNLEVDGGMRL